MLSVTWAKSAPMGHPPDQWLPLWQHLDDTADVAGMLWDEWVADSIRRLIASVLPGGEDDGRVLFTWLAGIHDVGKASPAFAGRVTELGDRMVLAGLPIGAMALQDRSKLRHEVASAAIVDRWLDQTIGLPGDYREQYTAVAAGHHGAYPAARVVGDAFDSPRLFGDGPWTQVQQALADRAAHRAGVAERWPEWREVRLPQAAQIALAGLVVMADWIASDEEYFPLLPIEVVPAVDPVDAALGDPKSVPPRASRAWHALSLSPGWSPELLSTSAAEHFARRFPLLGATPRPVQEVSAQRAVTMPTPGLMIVEAPMGEGKTEAAFLAAETLAARSGANGCFVALPTQATSNAMFDRMLRWLESLPAENGTRLSTALVHGKAALNDRYVSLPFGRGAVYLDEPEPDESAPSGRSSHRHTVQATVHEWMRGRKRAALSDFVVGTIDQVLFAALLARHVMLRHLSLVGKVALIDEVHAADVYMSRFLDRALEWLAAAGAPVVLLSATLPAHRRVELYLAYESGRRRFLGEKPIARRQRAAIHERLGVRLPYPSIVTTGADEPVIDTPTPSGRATAVTLGRLDDDLPALVEFLADRLRDGGCAVVIRNTVRRVQEAADALTDHFGADNVTVAHAQFLAADRVANDAALLRRFGPPGEGVERPVGPHVVVASQVVEQSLDVDFDLMVTDVAPVDLLLQRMGRLHRHVRADRPLPLREAWCCLTGAGWSSVPPKPDGGSQKVYGGWLLYRSLAVLADRWDGGTIQLPEDIAVLVHEAYEERSCPTGWQTVLDEARQVFVSEEARRRQTADAFALPPVGTAGTSPYGFSRGSAGNVDEDSPQGQGYVRDGGESVEVVVIQRGDDGTDRIPDWVDGGGEMLPLRDYPVPYAQAKALARCTLRLPFALVHEGIIDEVIDELERDWFDGWKKSPFLRGQLALVLDDDATRELAGHRLRYDTRMGLVVHRVEE